MSTTFFQAACTVSVPQQMLPNNYCCTEDTKDHIDMFNSINVTSTYLQLPKTYMLTRKLGPAAPVKSIV